MNKYAFRFEPAAWLGFARAVIYGAGLLWGSEWSEEQRVAALLVVETALTLVQRSFVTPNASL